MVFKLIFKEILRKNDSFQIIYEVFVDEDKSLIESGNIIFCKLNLKNQDLNFTILNKKKFN